MRARLSFSFSDCTAGPAMGCARRRSTCIIGGAATFLRKGALHPDDVEIPGQPFSADLGQPWLNLLYKSSSIDPPTG